MKIIFPFSFLHVIIAYIKIIKGEVMKKFWQEFKVFIAKGNVVDLAVAVIIGQAFNKIVSSLVNDIIMPLVSLAVGGVNVTDWKWVIKAAEYDELGNVTVAETALKYGVFIQYIIDFLIIAFTVFLIVKLFTISRNKLNSMNDQITQSIKERKKKRKKGKEVIEEVKSQEVVAEVAEPAPAPAPEPVVEQPSQSTNEAMIVLLTEIRDRLSQPKQD
jgi:large conductance mechanosensitive channel